MFEKQSFLKSIYNLQDIPKQRLPEIILCGRSNVGKSSFINSIFNRKDLAKISSTPGKTRSINYYLIDEKFYMVDLPGYGYAKASKTEREKWGKLVSNFISESGHIVLACHFIDSRHKPTELDRQLNSLLKHFKLPYLVILSKIDKLNQSETSSSSKNVKEALPELIIGENLFVYSSVKKTGKKEILKKFSSLF
ncbi:MAG: YihA family ribosome biogenesis GTP-binding protein [Ignavibacteriales bacterium]|nr:MAG: YihA family ribosome biogenesis GTP-binding protein [Ignavibacteriales bacterium]